MTDLLGLDSDDLLWYQMVSRAILVFAIALGFIRAAGMRSFGTKSAFDVVLNITIGAILGRAIAGHYPFFTCLLAAAVLCGCHRLTAYFAYQFPAILKLVEGTSVNLFRSSKKDEHALARHSINPDDIQRALHEQNIDSFDKVKAIWYETDGKISVIKKDK